MAVDFTFTSPMSSDCMPLNLETAKRHLAAAEDAKFAQERRVGACAAMRWALTPAAFSPWGGMGPHARDLLGLTTKRMTADTTGFSTEARTREIRETISFAIAREVAQQLALRCRITDC